MDTDKIQLVIALSTLIKGVMYGVDEAVRIAAQVNEAFEGGVTEEEIRAAEERGLTRIDAAIGRIDAAIAKRQAWEREQQG